MEGLTAHQMQRVLHIWKLCHFISRAIFLIIARETGCIVSLSSTTTTSAASGSSTCCTDVSDSLSSGVAIVLASAVDVPAVDSAPPASLPLLDANGEGSVVNALSASSNGRTA